ncbi:MAG: hypothetical protein M3O26_05025 [Pseudomonadota bacterium]|nr:hypothetical protein [Pseudomonadota bacterium]
MPKLTIVCANGMLFAAVTVIALSLSDARSQGLGAHASVTSSAPTEEVKLLRQQLNLLTGRVTELEKKAEDVKNNSDDDVQTKKMEQRLAAIETSQAQLAAELATAKKAEVANGGASHAAAGSRVQAPFQVFDEKGKVIFRVGLDAEHETPEAVIGDAEGGHIWFVAGKDRSFARFYRSKDRGGVQIVASPQEAYVAVKKPEEDVMAYLGSEADNEFGVFLSHGKTNSARLVIRPSLAGRLTLSDTDGSVTVEAGTMDNGKGQVKTGPFCCKPPGAIGPHQYIEGRDHE